MKAALMMVTYNRLKLTKKTIENILETTNHPYNLIIVDNGSQDGTVSYLKEILSDVTSDFLKKWDVISLEENKGVAIGRNIALFNAVQDKDVSWLATVDNDVILPDNWLSEAINIMRKNPNYGSIGVNVESLPTQMVTKNGMTFQEKLRGNLGTACMVFPKKLHLMLGFFNNKDYGLYGEEDADWGMRTRVLGFKLGYVKEMGRHLGEGERDVGEYRDFKTESHKNNLAKFNKNCRDYATKKKSLYIPFDINAVTD